MSSKFPAQVVCDNPINSVRFQLGTEVSICRDLFKYRTIERSGNCLIERYYFSIGKIRSIKPNESMLIPIYARIYRPNFEFCDVHLYAKGIGNALSICGELDNSDTIPWFAKNVISDIVIADLEMTDQNLATLLETYRTSNNDRNPRDLICLESMPNVGTDVSRMNGQPSIFSKIYSDHLREVLRSSERHGITNPTAIVCGEFHDQFLPWTDIDLNRSPNQKFSGPWYDPLTRIVMNNEEIVYQDLLRYHHERHDQIYRPPTEDDLNSEFSPITTFTPEIMRLCVLLNTIPAANISGQYSTPNHRNFERWTTYPVLTPSYFLSDVQSEPLRLTHEQDYTLRDILADLDRNALSVWFNKNDMEEIYIIIHVDGGKTYKFYIDLFYATLMSQSIICTDVSPTMSGRALIGEPTSFI